MKWNELEAAQNVFQLCKVLFNTIVLFVLIWCCWSYSVVLKILFYVFYYYRNHYPDVIGDLMGMCLSGLDLCACDPEVTGSSPVLRKILTFPLDPYARR